MRSTKAGTVVPATGDLDVGLRVVLTKRSTKAGTVSLREEYDDLGAVRSTKAGTVVPATVPACGRKS